jgi:hypothetical protein
MTVAMCECPHEDCPHPSVVLVDRVGTQLWVCARCRMIGDRLLARIDQTTGGMISEKKQ